MMSRDTEKLGDVSKATQLASEAKLLTQGLNGHTVMPGAEVCWGVFDE